MDIKDSLSKNCVCFLRGQTKVEAIIQLLELLSSCIKIDSIDKIKDKILYRENLMSTGIGLGIGIPHIRTEEVQEPIIAIGISKEGLQDYESIDGKPVWVVLMIIAGKDQHREYIKLMSQAVKKLKDVSIIEKIMNSETSEEVYRIITGN